MPKVQVTFEIETNAPTDLVEALTTEHIDNLADHIRAEGHSALPSDTVSTKVLHPRVPRLLEDTDSDAELPPHSKFVITTLERAGLSTRHYEGKNHCTDLAHAIYILYMHLCRLDGENLDSWDISTHTLGTIIGNAVRGRTFKLGQ